MLPKADLLRRGGVLLALLQTRMQAEASEALEGRLQLAGWTSQCLPMVQLLPIYPRQLARVKERLPS